MDELNKTRLIGRIERSLDEVVNLFTKADILSWCHGDSETANQCLKKWEVEGKLELLKSFDTANNDDQIVRMKSYINGKSPWPNWPPK